MQVANRSDSVRPAPAITRLPGIEGLRAVAATTILIYHCWLFDGGDRLGTSGVADTVMWNLSLGVTLFFALSAFLLYRPFAAAIARGEALPDVRRYLRNRALRILPAYWVILLVTALVLGTVATRDGESLVPGSLDDPMQLLKAALLIQNYVPGTVGIGIGPAWSLAVEAAFYLLLPLLALGVARAARGCRARSKRIAILLTPALGLLLVGLSGKYVAGGLLDGTPGEGWESNWYSVVERSFWAQADLFSFGMAAAVAHTEVADGRLKLPRGWRPAALAIALAIVVACAATLGHGQLSYLPQNTAVALAAALLVAAVSFPSGSGRAPRLQRVSEASPLVAVGLVSYSVFLWHVPVIHWLTEHGATRAGWAGFGWNLALTALVAGRLAMLSYRLVELPALRRKQGRPPADSPMAAAQLEAAP